MDFTKKDTDRNKNSEVVYTTKGINAIIAQRDKLQEILIQRDMTIEHLLSNGKENVHGMPKKQQLDDKRTEVSSETTLHTQRIEQSSLTNVKYEEMRLECSLLKDINESLMDDNESLKMINRILQSNYDILRERLATVQSEHQLRLTQLHGANEVINKSLKNARTKKRIHSDRSVETPETHNKRRRLASVQSGNNSQIGVTNRNGSIEIDVVIESSSDCSSSNVINNDMNGTEELDRDYLEDDLDEDVEDDIDNDINDDLDDDLELIPTEPICINLDDISDGEDDCKAMNISEDCKFNNNSSEDGTLTDDDSLVESSFIKPLSQYSNVPNIPTTIDNQPPKPGE